MFCTRILIAATVCAVLANPGRAHDDVVARANQSNTKIVTGGRDDVAGTTNDFQRVFGLDFGEDPSDPYIIGDPGFNSPAGSLPVNKTLSFHVVGNLRYWDGDGPVAFASAAGGITLGLKRGANTVTIAGDSPSQPGLTIGSTGALGGFHVHLESLLNASDGTDPAEPNAPDGIYLVELALKLNQPTSLADSDPIFIVYNNHADDVHDEAINWVEAHLVPEPSSWLLAITATIGLIPLLRRRAKVA